MADFDYDKIKDMEYNPNRGCYVGKNREGFHVTPYSNETWLLDFYFLLMLLPQLVFHGNQFQKLK